MNPRKAFVFLALFLALPTGARASDAFEGAFEEVRVKARTAYLTRAPVDQAVTDADRRRLASSPGASPERFQRTVELLEAVKAVNALQDGEGSILLAPAEKTRLTELVRTRLKITGAEASALDRSVPGLERGAAGGPSEALLRRFEAGEIESRKKAATVMGGAGVLNQIRSPADGSAGGGVFSGGSRSGAPDHGLRASDFRPQYKTGPVMEMPGLPAKSFEPPTWFERFSAATQTNVPVPGVETASAKFNSFAAGRMKEAAARDMEGAALLEQGGAVNVAKAGWKAVESFGNRLVAGDPAAVKAVAYGVGAAVGVAAFVIAAPAVGAVGAALTVAKVGLTAYSAYGMVNAVPAFVKKPDYLNAATIVLNAAGAGYAGPLVKKTGELATKGITTVATVTPKSVAGAAALSAIPIMARAGNVAAKGSAVAVKAGHEAGVDMVTETIADTAKVVQYRGGPYASLSAVGTGAAAR